MVPTGDFFFSTASINQNFLEDKDEILTHLKVTYMLKSKKK